MKKKRILIWLIFAWLMAASAAAEDVKTDSSILAGALLPVDFGETAQTEYIFSPSANGLYSLYFFPNGDSTARGEVYSGGELLAEGEGRQKLFSGRLNSDKSYRVTVEGRGSGWLEVARETTSRSYDSPLILDDGESYEKFIARGGDVHWYAMTAESSGAALIACSPNSAGLRMQLHLFDENGFLLDKGDFLASGSAAMGAVFDAQKTYYIRVSAAHSRTGKYQLTVQRSENSARPESVRLSESALTLMGRSVDHLDTEFYPADACPLVFFDSSSPAVATVRPGGWVEGRQEGKCVITAYAFGGAQSACHVQVHQVPVESISFGDELMILSVGESHALTVLLSPANATFRQLSYTSSDEKVASVRDGIVTAVGTGSAEITVTSGDGSHSAVLPITVNPPPRRYRALLVGQQTYASTVELEREGSVTSVESIRALIHSASFDGAAYSTSMVMDLSRDAVLAGIRGAFAGAREEDVSLLYLTCHGFYSAGMTFFVMADGSTLSAVDLERELSKIPGEIVLLIDCCGSGGLVGKAGSADDLLRGVTQVFQGNVGSAITSGSKYHVIASAFLDQDSYRVAFGEDGQMSTVFARALCDAAGWSIDRNAPASMNADTNYDGKITFNELDSYLSRRMLWYLRLAGDYVQNVCIYPKNDNFVLFARSGE